MITFIEIYLKNQTLQLNQYACEILILLPPVFCYQGKNIGLDLLLFCCYFCIPCMVLNVGPWLLYALYPFDTCKSTFAFKVGILMQAICMSLDSEFFVWSSRFFLVHAYTERVLKSNLHEKCYIQTSAYSFWDWSLGRVCQVPCLHR